MNVGRRLLLAGPVLALALLAVQCGSGSSGDWLPRLSSDVLVLSPGLRGTLSRDGHCVYVEGTSYGRLLLAVGPDDDVTWDDNSDALEIAGQAFPVGGSAPPALGLVQGPAAAEWQKAPDPGCDDSQIYVVTESSVLGQ